MADLESVLAEARELLADPTSPRLIDQPPLVKAEAMRADPDAYYAQVRAERDAEAEGAR